ncbi:hypothetical protein PIB30_036068 [Stylosanthes scabra]|uniref:S-adenosyl-L-methionine-dependent methyltransferase n=1 Tax=Stylosanthes scabra TaxID=79078 RepID=A0ABU6QCR4_9FABA|nr:hypothetical protein [Stylosanthes scabra]
MACWSAENATKAYLSTLKMGQKAKEPDVAEFISALAAGNNAQTMVVACAGAAGSTALALVAAANQTGGRVICIVNSHQNLIASKTSLGIAAQRVQFIVRELSQEVMVKHTFDSADFLLIDCNLDSHQEILKKVVHGGNNNGTVVVVGYNAFSCKGSCWFGSRNTQLLPIGEGLLVTKFGTGSNKYGGGGSRSMMMNRVNSNKSRWVVKVDKCTGEEHVFRVRFPPQGKVIHA